MLLVANAQAEEGFRNEAIASLRTLLQIAEAPVQREFKKGEFNFSEANKPYFYWNLVSAQADLGDEEGVRLTLQKGRLFCTTAKDQQLQPSVSQSLIGLQARSRDLIGALRMLDDPDLFQERNAASDRHFALLDIVSQLKAGDDKVAAPILEKARQSMEVNTDEIRKTWTEVNQIWSQNHDLSDYRHGRSETGTFLRGGEDGPGHRPAPREARRKRRSRRGRNHHDRRRSNRAYRVLFESSSQVADRPWPLKYEALDSEWHQKASTLALIGEAQAKAGDQAGARLGRGGRSHCRTDPFP